MLLAVLVFFLNFQNYAEFNRPLQFDALGIQTHFSFGYQVQPFPLPYAGISRIEGGKLHSLDSDLKLQKDDCYVKYIESDNSL